MFGLEADLQASGSNGSLTTAAVPFVAAGGGGNVITGTLSSSLETDIQWFGTVRGRFGYVFDTVVLYGTGGLAFGEVDLRGTGVVNGTLFSGAAACGGGTSCPASASASFAESEMLVGWTLGAGLEGVAWTRDWTWKVEYLYVDLGTMNGTSSYAGASSAPPVFIVASGSVAHEVSVREHVFRVGLNYRIAGR
jgi:outer membrane immunogenic protein